MPVIRLAGKGGGFFQQAGQAAGAYDQATADSRRQQYARERIAQQRLDAQRQEGLQAQQRDFNNQATTRQLDLREKAIDADYTRRSMRDAVKQSNGVPISGLGTIQMVTRLAELDRVAYQQLAPQLQGMTGFDENNPATPEALDALPNLPDIYAAIAPAFAHAVKQADVAAVQTGFEETVGSFIDDPKLLKTDKEWFEWHQPLAEALARAELSPGGATMALMGPLYKTAKLEGARIAANKQQRADYTDLFNEKVKGFKDSQKLQSAKLRMADMPLSQNPQQTFVAAMVRLDPDFELAHQMGMRTGQGQGATQAVVMQAQREAQAAQQAPVAAQPRGTDHDAEIQARAQEPMKTLDPKTHRKAEGALNPKPDNVRDFQAYLSEYDLQNPTRDEILEVEKEWREMKAREAETSARLENSPPPRATAQPTTLQSAVKSKGRR